MGSQSSQRWSPPTVSRQRLWLRWQALCLYIQDLTIGLLWGISTLQTLVCSCTTLLPLQAVSMSQAQSSPQACPLKSKFPYPASVRISKVYLGRGSAVMGTDPLCLSLSSACCKPVGALSSEPLNLPICPS